MFISLVHDAESIVVDPTAVFLLDHAALNRTPRAFIALDLRLAVALVIVEDACAKKYCYDRDKADDRA